MQLIPGLPLELAEDILLRLPAWDLILKCRLVSQDWNALIASPQFWQHHLAQHASYQGPNLKKVRDMPGVPWQVLASLSIRNPLDRNLIQNCSGEQVSESELQAQVTRQFQQISTDQDYPHWNIDNSVAEGWKVKPVPEKFEETLRCDPRYGKLLPYDPVSFCRRAEPGRVG